MRSIELVLLSALALLVPACAATTEPSDDSNEDTSHAALSGMFRPKTDADGADIRLVEFGEASRYRLVPRGCTDGACVESGTFSFDRANGRLDLDPDGERASYSLPLQIKAARTSSTLAPRNLVGADDSLVDGSSSLVSNVELVGQEYELVQTDTAVETYSGSEWQNNLTLNESNLRAASQKKAIANCTAAQREVPTNGVNHCENGNYIWGNRLVNTTSVTACERGTLTTTCTTIITMKTNTVGG